MFWRSVLLAAACTIATVCAASIAAAAPLNLPALVQRDFPVPPKPPAPDEQPFLHPPRFPALGTNYAHAKRSLLAQGLRLSPDRPKHPDRRYRELDCGNDYQVAPACRALFLARAKSGWRYYVVVLVNEGDLSVVRADFADTRQEFLPVPPPPPPDAPKLKGTYSMIRRRLLAVGYRPIRSAGWDDSGFCRDTRCRSVVRYPELNCAADVDECFSRWRSRGHRVLEVTTLGETVSNKLYSVEWSSCRETCP